MEKVSTYTGAMFDKLDKLKTAAIGATVTAYCATKSAVGAVSALIGNPLTKDYEVGRHIASFGPNLAWKVLEGKRKTTGQVCALYCLIVKHNQMYKGLTLPVFKIAITLSTLLYSAFLMRIV